MKKLFFTLAMTLSVGILTTSTAKAGVVAATANFRADAAVAGGVNTGGLKIDPSGTTVDGGLLYANGSDVLKIQLTIDDTADTGAIFTAILTIEGVRENPDALPMAPDGILTGPTTGHILMNGSQPAPDALARNGDQVSFSIGSFVQTSGPAAQISFDGYTNVILDQINNGTAGAKSFTFGSTSFAGPGGGPNGPATIAITGATGETNEVFDGTGTERFRWRSVEASFTVTADTGSVLLGDVDLNGTVEFLDISPFIAVLSASGNQAEADCNEDGIVSFLDIAPFIAILSGQ